MPLYRRDLNRFPDTNWPKHRAPVHCQSVERRSSIPYSAFAGRRRALVQGLIANVLGNGNDQTASVEIIGTITVQNYIAVASEHVI